MSEFEKFWKDYDQDGDLGEPTHSENDKIVAEAIWDHQQKKISLMKRIIYILKNYDAELVTEEIKQLENELGELG